MKNIVFFLNLQKKSSIIFILFLLILGTILDLFGLSLIIPTIKVISDYENLKILINSAHYLNFIKDFNQNELVFICLITFFLLNIFKGLVFIYLNWKTNHFAKDINQKISENLIRYYSLINYEEMINKSSSTLIRNITEEIEGVSAAALNFLNMVVELFVIIAIFIFIIYIEPGGVTIISFILAIGLYLYRKILVKKLIIWGQRRQNYYLKKISTINEIFHSFSELKILKKINFFSKHYLDFNREYFDNIIKYRISQVIPRFLVETLAVLGVSVALIYLIILKGEQEQIIYSLAILGASSLRILPSINRVLNFYNSFKFSDAAIDLIKNEMEKFINLTNQAGINNSSLTFSKKIELKNITYCYPNKTENVLKNLNFEINKDDIIGIRGETGSGKTTLLKILLGLLKPNKGELVLDNTNIHADNLINSWFDKIAYVPQDIYLLNDSIKNNIAYAKNDKKVENESYNFSLKTSLSNQFIQNMVNKDKTIVGENGIKLSGGQKQRIGIARALYLERDILILDEATNSLDETTERQIIDNILKLKKRPTIIFVSHKSANFEICNKIFNISNGNLVISKL